MAVLIGNARIDENGKAHGGAAGDQTAREVCIQNWYAYPWNVVLRCTDAAMAEKIAEAMEYACANEHIGYDQYQRTTLFASVNALGWYPGNIRKISGNVETDCSALVAVCVNCAFGSAKVSKDIYTGNEQAALLATGKFQALTDSKYLTSSAYLRRGDILLNTVHHTAIVLSDGANSGAGGTASTASGKTVLFSTPKTYTNGSTEEICYADTALTVKTGSLNPRERCKCLGIVDGRYLVYYQVDGTNHYKTGFVEYAGGVSA